MKKGQKQKLSSDPRDLSHELRAAPEAAGAAGDAQNGWMASISRPFLVKFGDFEFPAALAHSLGGNVPIWQCANVLLWQCAIGTRAAGGGGGRFRAKVWSHWILLSRYPAAVGG